MAIFYILLLVRCVYKYVCACFCLSLPSRSLISFCAERTLHPSLYQATQLLAQVIPGVDEYYHLDGGDDEDGGGGGGDL